MIHAVIKFHTPCGIGTVFSTYETNKVEEGQKKVKEATLEVTKDVLSYVDAKERIVVNDKHPEQTVKRGLAPERNEAACKEVDELTKPGILREVKYQTWVANPVMVKKSDRGWRMCVEFTNINKACPKDCCPFPEINWKVESLSGLRFINMKLNPKKCFFGVEEDPLLGHLITKKEIKANPSKVMAITDLKESRMLKEIQSLNEKLAALSRFLSKGADRKETCFDLLRKQGATRGITKLLGIRKAHTSSRPRCKKATKAIELGEHDIEFKGRDSIKGKILPDFLAETPSVEDKDTETKKPETANEALNSRSMWKLYIDKDLSSDGFGADIMLVSPEGKEYTYPLSFEFKT
ncbi:hypothetical protein Tco_0896625, partial [Tanacetum coccineum]